MARPPRKRTGRASVSGLAIAPRRHVARGTIVTPWRRVPAVVRITRSILRAHRTMSTAASNTAVEIGRQLARVRDTLEHGQWLAWLDEAAPFTPRTAQNYLALAAWAEREPDHFARFGHIETTKLYRIAALPFKARDKLKIDEPIRVPGGAPKLLDVMSVDELDRVIGGLATPPVSPSPEIAKLVDGYRRRLTALGGLTEELLAQARRLDRDVVSELAAELLALAEQLQSAVRD